MKHLYWLLFITSLRIGWAAPVPLADASQPYDLFRASSLLEVRPGQVTIDALLRHPNQYGFVPTRNGLIHPNDRQRAYWFRVELTNPTTEPFFLHFVYSGTEHIAVYEVANGRVVGTRRLGRLEPETAEPFRYSKLFYPLQVSRKSGPHTLYIYMEGIYTTCLYFRARSAVNLLEAIHHDDLFYGLYYGLILIIVVYSFVLYLRLGEQDTLRYAIWVLFIGLLLGLQRGFTAEFLWFNNPSFERYAGVLAGVSGMLHVLFTISFLRLKRKAPLFYRIGQGVFAIYLMGIGLYLMSSYQLSATDSRIDILPWVALVEGVFSIVAGTRAYRRGFKPALYYIIGNLVFFASIFFFLQYANGRLPHSFWTYNSIYIGSGIEVILFTLALTYKVDLLKKRQDEAVREQLRLAQANEQLVAEQNVMLEEKVRLRTNELNTQKEELQHTLTTLRATQQQLIQKEKMASLGELTAGVAHEMQNPLNFVNNFAEVSVELIGELREEIQADNKAEALSLVDELVPNLQKIEEHGKRAGAIVRGMLEHSRSSTGARQPTDLNALADESLKLAYHGLRAKDQSFSATLITDYDANVGLVELMPQEVSRVLVNLCNNALYAVAHKAPSAESYEPTVWLSTARDNGYVTLRVRDNGTGIPETIQPKIFQPFFTTKPTGQGLGLGLSLSCDIITKGHSGQLDVQTEPGVFTEFSIKLPVASA